MTWGQARVFCSHQQAEMVVVESEGERREIAQLLKTLLEERWRFWVGVKKINGEWKANSGKTLTYKPWGKDRSYVGNCLRVGWDMRWYKAVCGATSFPGGYTFNPFCKKLK